MSKIFSTRLVPRFYEMDPFGHVNNAVFLNYLETARFDYLLQTGLSLEVFKNLDAFPVLARAEIDFLASVKAGEELIITGEVIKIGRTSFTMKQKIYKGKDVAALKAVMVMTFVDQRGKPTPIPDLFLKTF